MKDLQTSRSFYLPELDILRFFAFFAVFIHHVLPKTENAYQGKLAPFSSIIVGVIESGGFGVDLFFALSAFLITELLIREQERTNKINAIAFYVRRALRILPLYYAFLLLTIFVLPIWFTNESLEYPYNIGFLTIFGNWTCAFLGYPNSVAAPLWSISIEEQFYLIFPFLVIIFGTQNLKGLAFCFLLISNISRIFLVYLNLPHPGIWCNTFTRLDPIAGGILLALFLRKSNFPNLSLLQKRIPLFLLGMLILVLSAIYLDFSGIKSLLLYPLTALASVLLLYATVKIDVPNTKLFRTLIYLGQISYGLYVFHMLGIKIADIFLQPLLMSSGIYWICLSILALFITIFLAILSYNILEKPFLKLKKRFTFVQSR